MAAKQAKQTNAGDVTKVKEDIVDDTLEKLGLQTGGSLTLRVSRLAEHQIERVPADRLSGPCDVCGFRSDLDFSACPFCGAEGVDHAEAEPTQEAAPESGEGETTTEVVPIEADEKSLKIAEQAVREAMRKGADAYWELGKRLEAIYEPGVWKIAKNNEGEAYRSWENYVQERFGITKQYSYDLMTLAANFRREDFRVLAMRKLRAMLTLPPARREQLLSEAKEGKLSSERIIEICEAEGGSRASISKNPGRTQAATKAAAKRRTETAVSVAEQQGVTAISALEDVEIPLFARTKGDKGEEPKRALRLTDDPWGREETINGIVFHYRVVQKPKGLVLMIKRRRENPEEEAPASKSKPKAAAAPRTPKPKPAKKARRKKK